jgi:hypothetical protein
MVYLVLSSTPPGPMATSWPAACASALLIWRDIVHAVRSLRKRLSLPASSSERWQSRLPQTPLRSAFSTACCSSRCRSAVARRGESNRRRLKAWFILVPPSTSSACSPKSADSPTRGPVRHARWHSPMRCTARHLAATPGWSRYKVSRRSGLHRRGRGAAGVRAPSGSGASGSQFWSAMKPSHANGADKRETVYLAAYARLRPGVSIERALRRFQ